MPKGNKITIDKDAAGYGWFIDQTPGDDSEYHDVEGVMTAFSGSLAYGRMDLLSVVAHEIGHLLGMEHSASESLLMNETLEAGTRLDDSRALEFEIATSQS